MKDKTSIVFTGDIGFDKYMDGKWDDPNIISKEVLDFLHSGNHVLANVEGAIVSDTSTLVTGVEQRLLHTMNPQAIKVLNSMHTDIWNLDNNHIMDAGEEGARQTLTQAKKHNIKTIGAGMNIKEASTPLILNEAGGVGILAVGYRRGCKPADKDKAGCLLWNEMDLIQERIKEIKKNNRWCIIVAHGGEEFTSLPTPYTRDRYLAYLKMGADIIVSHHPHVPMNYELIDNKAIFYSLGNFIFDTDYQRAQFNTEKGVLLKVVLTKDKFSFESLGILIDRETEHIIKGELPKIFTNVPAEEYLKLEPLAAKMFIAATKRQQIYLNPDKFKNATDKEWEEHFLDPKRSGRVIGEGLDFHIILPLAKQEEKKEWQKSKLEEVKDYILEQM
ncbi:MAG: CapA family protein [Thomasclavelia sp.]|jgi:hypothetical protein|nr:CapA family protein [Thomasclavelia sp.]